VDADWLLPLFAAASRRRAFQAAKAALMQVEDGVGAGDAEAPLFVAAPDAGLLVAAAPVAVPEFDAVLPGLTEVPSPSVPAPPVVGEPPVSTVLLAWMMACRNGWTPRETLAMTATPASTITGRSQLMAARPLCTDGRWLGSAGGFPGGNCSPAGRRRSRGQPMADRFESADSEAQ
jgi:hypothetical protein